MARANLKTRPEDQHYVSAAYLRGFVPDGERALFVRRRYKKTWFRQVPENIATRKNFYSILREEGCWDDTLEDLLAREIEGPGAGFPPAVDQRLSRRTLMAWLQQLPLNRHRRDAKKDFSRSAVGILGSARSEG
jgi:hypothetical protein